MVFVSSVLLPFYPFYKGETPTASLFWGLMTLIVILFTIIPLFLNLYALKGMNSSSVGILMYTNPLINFLLALFYFKEVINLSQALAYLLILVSIMLFNEKLLFKSKTPDNE